MPQGPGQLPGESGNILDAFKSKGDAETQGGKLGVSVFVWRAALDSISFMPLTTADSNGGVIITDWYSTPATPSERVKVNVLITGKSVRADALKVTLFKQQKDAAGSWKDVAVNPETERQLEDAILTKARALRVQARASSAK